MNQQQLIDDVARLLGLPKQAVKDVLMIAGDVIIETLSEDQECVLPRLGKLSIKRRKARDGRNPRTGEAIKIRAKRSVSFRAGKALKDAIGRPSLK